MMAAEAVDDLGFLMCFYLNRNCLLRLEVSMWSGSVTVSVPEEQRLSMAKFFIS